MSVKGEEIALVVTLGMHDESNWRLGTHGRSGQEWQAGVLKPVLEKHAAISGANWIIVNSPGGSVWACWQPGGVFRDLRVPPA